MSFTYDFELPNDTVQFAYAVPYTYSALLKFISTLPNVKQLPPMKSLSGLPIPVLEVTDQSQAEYNKQTVLITARVHPGQANSSYVVEGMLEYLCSNDGKQLRRRYIFYVVPMVNPDGVVAGNYRTSLFGKDLNRTFDQSRKYAFPQTFHLVQLAKNLKATYKRRFNIYLDLHGHSVKKNVFMYGPDFGIQHTNYDLSRQLPRLLGNLTSLFRYYSCIFRISSQKATTARAILNRQVDIPFTYTMESSSGFYYDAASKTQMPFTSKKYKQMGVYLCKSLALLSFDNNFRIKKVVSKDIIKDDYHPEGEGERNSDDEISQGKSDSQPEEEDLTEQELSLIQKSIEGKKEQGMKLEKDKDSPIRSVILHKFDSKELKTKKPNVYLPPINTMNRAAIFSNRHRMKQAFRHERLKNIESQSEAPLQKFRKPRYSISQMVTDFKDRDQLKPRKQYNICNGFRISK